MERAAVLFTHALLLLLLGMIHESEAFVVKTKRHQTFVISTSRRHSTASTESKILEGKPIDHDFTPVNNMILVRVAGVVEATAGGVFLTGKQKIKKTEGTVVATGSGRMDQDTGFQYPMPVREGQRVIYGKYDGVEVMYNGAKHALIRDDDVLVVFNDEDDEASVVWDHVLVQIPNKTGKGNDSNNNSQSGGLLIAKSSAAKAKKGSVGTVVKVGPGRYANNGVLMEMDVKVGDMIKFRDFAAQEVQMKKDKEEYAVVRMTDILAKF